MQLNMVILLTIFNKYNQMRFRLILEVNKRAAGDLLPINYQYEQSAAIYHILASGNKEFSEWLHENGYATEAGKRFKLFTYSPIKVEKRKILPEFQRLRVLSDTVEWQISFLPEKSTEKFIQGIFTKQIFEIGDRRSTIQFKVQNIEVLPSPEYTAEMEFAAMSPICIRYKNEDGSITYLPPTDSRAKGLLLTGLLSRYEAMEGKAYTGSLDFDFEVLNEPKRKLITIKSNTPEETRVAGYLCQFRMKAPTELMKIAYESGVGSGNSQGFGCVRVK